MQWRLAALGALAGSGLLAAAACSSSYGSGADPGADGAVTPDRADATSDGPTSPTDGASVVPEAGCASPIRIGGDGGLSLSSFDTVEPPGTALVATDDSVHVTGGYTGTAGFQAYARYDVPSTVSSTVLDEDLSLVAIAPYTELGCSLRFETTQGQSTVLYTLRPNTGGLHAAIEQTATDGGATTAADLAFALPPSGGKVHVRVVAVVTASAHVSGTVTMDTATQSFDVPLLAAPSSLLVACGVTFAGGADAGTVDVDVDNIALAVCP